ncbi:MAG: Rubrerythrin [Methanoregulaceae archaeon PtaB.Bin152]|nr:MAG: Rubrerythrin [Methanoregulaceae archaeon PtaB.Bin152]
MPEFATAFSGMNSDRKLSHSELVRAIRLMIADEYEAIQVYTQLAESIENELAREVLRDIADEERVHAGEFLRLLYELAPDEAGFYAEGAAEVEAEIAKLAPRGTSPGAEEKKGGATTIGSLKE